MAKQFFNASDAQGAKFAEFFVTINDRRYSMFNAKNLEATATIDTVDVPRLGSVIKGKKANGLEIKLTFTVYKVSEMFDELVRTFKDTGALPTFECQVSNYDEATGLGRSTKVYKNCTLNGDVLLNMFDADGELVEQEIECYALDFDSAERYTEPAYM